VRLKREGYHHSAIEEKKARKKEKNLKEYFRPCGRKLRVNLVEWELWGASKSKRFLPFSSANN